MIIIISPSSKKKPKVCLFFCFDDDKNEDGMMKKLSWTEQSFFYDVAGSEEKNVSAHNLFAVSLWFYWEGNGHAMMWDATYNIASLFKNFFLEFEEVVCI